MVNAPFFLEIWKFRKFPVPFGISTRYEFSREKLQDGGESFESTLLCPVPELSFLPI